MTERFNPFPKLSGRYGAPMGRHGGTLSSDLEPSQLCVSRPQGEYDSGGAYWGLGEELGPVWAVWQRAKGREGVAYVRATSKQGAIRAALNQEGEV